MKNFENISESIDTDGELDASPPPQAASKDVSRSTKKLIGANKFPMSEIVPDPDQPRETISESALEALAYSLKHHGQLQPIVLRKDETGQSYIIVVGERRWQAALRLGWKYIDGILRETMNPDEIFGLQVIENCQRENLNPIELARGVRRLIDIYKWNQNTVANELGFSEGHISKVLDLLNLSSENQKKIIDGELSMAKAYERAARERSTARRKNSVYVDVVNYDGFEYTVKIMSKRDSEPFLTFHNVLKKATNRIKDKLAKEDDRRIAS